MKDDTYDEIDSKDHPYWVPGVKWKATPTKEVGFTLVEGKVYSISIDKKEGLEELINFLEESNGYHSE